MHCGEASGEGGEMSEPDDQEYKRKPCPNCGKLNDGSNVECYWCDYEFEEVK